MRFKRDVRDMGEASDLLMRLRPQELPALLLNELQEQERTNAAQQRTIETQRDVIAALSARVERLEAR